MKDIAPLIIEDYYKRCIPLSKQEAAKAFMCRINRHHMTIYTQTDLKGEKQIVGYRCYTCNKKNT